MTNFRTKLESWVGTFFVMCLRLVVGIALIALVILVVKGLREDNYLIQAFEVPESFEKGGYNGAVVSRKIQDKVKEIKDFVGSSKIDSTLLEVDANPDLQVDVMGFGLSLNALKFHIRNIVGKENKVIGGELTDLDNRLTLTLRMSGYGAVSYEKKYEDKKEVAFEALLEKAGRKVLANTDPYRLALYLIEKNEYQRAEQFALYLIENNRDLEWAYLAWGKVLSAKGENEEAIKKYKKAIQINPKFKQAHMNLAWQFLKQGAHDEAITAFNQVIKIDKKNRNARNGKAVCLSQKGEADEALAIFEELIAEKPEQSWYYANAADLLMRLKKDTIAATKMFQRASQNAKDGPSKYMTLAGYYYTINKLDSAEIYTKKILELNPKHSIALMRLINYYYYTKRYSEAIKIGHTFATMHPKKGWDAFYQKHSAMNLTAIAHYQLEQYDSAFHYVNIAIEMDPSQSAPYTTLAEIYGFKGDLDNFYKNLQIALDKGFPLENLLDDEPYKSLKNQSRFKAIIAKYYKGRDMAVPSGEDGS